VECALWFHDAIYEPMSKSNEERSANWAAEFGERVGVASEAVARIRAHIMATRHVALPPDDDSRLLVDIDLAILGAAPNRYEEFERDVRKDTGGCRGSFTVQIGQQYFNHS
jgi:predicted metal-dependent HD superfamily phosphohydrolase